MRKGWIATHKCGAPHRLHSLKHPVARSHRRSAGRHAAAPRGHPSPCPTASASVAALPQLHPVTPSDCDFGGRRLTVDPYGRHSRRPAAAPIGRWLLASPRVGCAAQFRPPPLRCNSMRPAASLASGRGSQFWSPIGDRHFWVAPLQPQDHGFTLILEFGYPPSLEVACFKEY